MREILVQNRSYKTARNSVESELGTSYLLRSRKGGNYRGNRPPWVFKTIDKRQTFNTFIQDSIEIHLDRIIVSRFEIVCLL